ncbi:hypothetical protein GCM10009844_38910 [Nocardioides koreensis]|uniref:Uncharacterized protein n=1 Tax=Nocardioides koreensis TaxID=433651 RepID=A0ABP5LTU9_9ACTN
MAVGWRRSTTVTVLVFGVAAMPLAGCSDASRRASAPPSHPAPTGFASCNDLAPQRADGFVVIGSDWSGEQHAYGEEATVFACVYPPAGGVVRLVVSGQAIHVHPLRERVSAFPSGVVPFRVRVDPGGSGDIDVRQDMTRGSYSAASGPTIESGDDGWRFIWDDSH